MFRPRATCDVRSKVGKKVRNCDSGGSMIEHIRLVRNVGQFESVNAGTITLGKLALGYAENSRGKTTLAAIFRSSSTGEASWIIERARLGAVHPPHVVLSTANSPAHVFRDGAWSASLPTIAVFDDRFVAENVCSGIEIAAEHRQNLHELILGAQGVSLSNVLQEHVTAIEAHNREIKVCADTIPAAARGNLSADQFCDLGPDSDSTAGVEVAERALAAAQAGQEVVLAEVFDTSEFVLPGFDIERLQAFLARDLPGLEAEAAQSVQSHISMLGEDAESWLADGVQRSDRASAEVGRDICPFCAQDLTGSPLIAHYRAYFSEGYAKLKSDIAGAINYVEKSHGGDVTAAFERTVRVGIQRRDFWQKFLSIPDIVLYTAVLARAWYRARDNILVALRTKQAAPLETILISDAIRREIELHNEGIAKVTAVREQLERANAEIAIVKERSATASVLALRSDLARLEAVAARQDPTVMPSVKRIWLLNRQRYAPRSFGSRPAQRLTCTDLRYSRLMRARSTII
jgi:wobble nucleotide-excising tRNase